jgi:hypothetical protein
VRPAIVTQKERTNIAEIRSLLNIAVHPASVVEADRSRFVNDFGG